MGVVIFQDLRITPNGKELCIDAIIAPYKYYDGMYICNIAIDSDDTFIPNGPSDKPLLSISFEDDGSKERSLLVAAEQFGWENFAEHMLYIYVTVDGVPDSVTPCGWDNATTLGVTLWWEPIYRAGIHCIQSALQNDKCFFPRDCADYVLRLNMLRLAIKTARYEDANKLIKNWKSVNIVDSSCCCS